MNIKEEKSHLQSSIVKLLLKNTRMRFTDIQNTLKISKPVLSYHLKILRNNNTIKSNDVGREKFYVLIDIKKMNFEYRLDCLYSMYVKDSNLFPIYRIDLDDNEIMKYLGDKVSGLYIFLILKSIVSGKDHINAFDSKGLRYYIMEILNDHLFRGMDPDYDELLTYFDNDSIDKFYQEAQKMLKNKKCKNRFLNVVNAMKEIYPREISSLEIIDVRTDPKYF